MQKTKALSWLFSREYQKSGKAGRFLFLGCGRSGNPRGKTWGLISLAIRALAPWPCHGGNSSHWLLALHFASLLMLRFSNWLPSDKYSVSLNETWNSYLWKIPFKLTFLRSMHQIILHWSIFCTLIKKYDCIVYGDWCNNDKDTF